MNKKVLIGKNSILGFVLVSLSTLLLSFGQILYKEGAMRFTLDFYALITNYPLLLGVVVHFAAFLLFITALKHGTLSFIYPVVATGYLWVNILAVVFLNEVVSQIEWSGVFLIMIGIMLITVGDKSG